ncbi:ribokinase [Leifsonia sp. NPDC058230]|uniref:ribokinase n=1 Tax=Leifsonia sp. NPDC058230 TaxID=3346391 RepID=UPI0036D87039
MTHIYVFGSINRDLIASVDTLPRPGETQVSRDFLRRGGGKGANQAFAASRIADDDVVVHLVACVGRDEEGQSLTAELNASGVDTTYVTAVDAPTGLAMIQVAADGENTIVVVPGANHLWPAGSVRSVPLAADDIVVCQLETPLDVVAEIGAHARASGARLVVNAAPYDARAAEIVRSADIVVVNEGEAAGFLGVEAFDAELLAGSASIGGEVIVTLGGSGSLLRGFDGLLATVDAFAVDVVDTVGAGDAFVGGLVAALAGGDSVREAVDVAMAAGALTVGVNGPRDPALSRATVDALRRADRDANR